MDRRFGTWSQLSLAHLLISYGFFFLSMWKESHTQPTAMMMRTSLPEPSRA